MIAKYLNRAQAAEYIRENFNIPSSPEGLAQHATDGTGPIYRRFGNTTLYDPRDIQKWFEERATKPIRAAKEVPWNKRRSSSRADQASASKDAQPVLTRQVPDQQPEA
jgi:hypothetical protein